MKSVEKVSEPEQENTYTFTIYEPFKNTYTEMMLEIFDFEELILVVKGRNLRYKKIRE